MWIAIGVLLGASASVPVVILTARNATNVAPGASTHCTLGYDNEDVQVRFTGENASGECDIWQTLDVLWYASTTTVTADTMVCSGSHGGLSWTVVDDGAQLLGTEACASLNNWVEGGQLSVP